MNNISTNRIHAFVKYWHIHEALRYLNCSEITHRKKVAQHQKNAMSVTYVSNKKYTIKSIARAFKYFALSREAYNRPIEDFELPSVHTLTVHIQSQHY